MMPHNTVPMLSSLLLGHIHTIYDCKNSKSLLEYHESNDANSENEPSELGSIKIELDNTGNLVENNQFLD